MLHAEMSWEHVLTFIPNMFIDGFPQHAEEVVALEVSTAEEME